MRNVSERAYQLPAIMVVIMNTWDEKGEKVGKVQPIPYEVEMEKFLEENKEVEENNPDTCYELFSIVSTSGSTLKTSKYSALVKR